MDKINVAKVDCRQDTMTVDVEMLMKLRLVISRFGEMDKAKWWNTKGLLGEVGQLALSRGFPKTYIFAQARAVFAVAGSRSEELFDPIDSVTLWRLPIDLEDRFEDSWSTWLANPDLWVSFVHELELQTTKPLIQALRGLDLISDHTIERCKRLRRADDLRSVPIRLEGQTQLEALSLLAAGFHHSEPGKLAIPYIRTEEFPRE